MENNDYLCGMKSEKQKLVLDILGKGRYRVNSVSGVLESFRVGVQEWVIVKPNILPSGYSQHIIHGGRGNGVRVVVYLHVLVYISVHGEYEEGMVINHKDLDKGNNCIDNLEAVSVKESVDNSYRSQVVSKSGSYSSLIRYNEIQAIRRCISENPSWSKSKVSRAVGLNRIPVTRIINKIVNGEVLKFDDERYGVI